MRRLTLSFATLAVCLWTPACHVKPPADEPEVFAWIDEIVTDPGRRGKLEPKINAALKELVERYEKVSGKKVHWPDAKPQITKFHTDSVENAVVWASGSIAVGFAKNSILIARGAVTVAHSTNTSVIAGQIVNILRQNSAKSSGAEGLFDLVLSGAPLSISHARGAIIAAGDRPDVGNTDNCVDGSSVPPPKSRSIAGEAQLAVRDAIDDRGIILAEGLTVKIGQDIGQPFPGDVLSSVTSSGGVALLESPKGFRRLKLDLADAPEPGRDAVGVQAETTSKIFDRAYRSGKAKEVADATARIKARRQAIEQRCAQTEAAFGTKYSLWFRRFGEGELGDLLREELTLDLWRSTLGYLEQYGNANAATIAERTKKIRAVIDVLESDKSKSHLRYKPEYRELDNELGALESLAAARNGTPVPVPFQPSSYRSAAHP